MLRWAWGWSTQSWAGSSAVHTPLVLVGAALAVGGDAEHVLGGDPLLPDVGLTAHPPAHLTTQTPWGLWTPAQSETRVTSYAYRGGYSRGQQNSSPNFLDLIYHLTHLLLNFNTNFGNLRLHHLHQHFELNPKWHKSGRWVCMTTVVSWNVGMMGQEK